MVWDAFGFPGGAALDPPVPLRKIGYPVSLLSDVVLFHIEE